MAPLSRTQLETLSEGLLHLQVRLNDLTIRLYKSVNREIEMFQSQRLNGMEPVEELPVVMAQEIIETTERSLV